MQERLGSQYLAVSNDLFKMNLCGSPFCCYFPPSLLNQWASSDLFTPDHTSLSHKRTRVVNVRTREQASIRLNVEIRYHCGTLYFVLWQVTDWSTACSRSVPLTNYPLQHKIKSTRRLEIRNSSNFICNTINVVPCVELWFPRCLKKQTNKKCNDA